MDLISFDSKIYLANHKGGVMMYPVYEIDNEQAVAIINKEENYLNDLKAIEIKPAKLSETVSAFSNAIGGDIYVGIDEDRTTQTRSWRGFETPEDANAITQVLIGCHNLGNHLSFEYLVCKGQPGHVLHVTVKKVKEVVRSTSGDVFVRVNAGKIKIDTEEKLRRLEFDKGIVTFENEWVECPLERVENSESIINFMINVIPTGEPKKYLENQDLIKNDCSRVSGVLLFCDEPAVFCQKDQALK